MANLSEKDLAHNSLSDCASRGDFAGIALLLAQGADPCRNYSEALLRASSFGHAECARLLIPVSDPKANNCHALRNAAAHGHAECVKLLIPACE